MAETSYYVYALKDPRTSPAKPFYIGKGTGTRAYDHLIKPNESRKGNRIRDIVEAGHDVLVTQLADGLSELQAIKIEAELISAFGTEASGASDYGGGSKDYLSYSVMGLLMREGKLARESASKLHTTQVD
jgi:hypothetical protein